MQSAVMQSAPTDGANTSLSIRSCDTPLATHDATATSRRKRERDNADWEPAAAATVSDDVGEHSLTPPLLPPRAPAPPPDCEMSLDIGATPTTCEIFFAT